MTRPRPHVIVILGPTAVGKTALSVRLARDFDGEVISADSRQIYRYMDIGTAKATSEEQAQAPHHLVDIVDPDQELTLAHFQRLTYHLIDQIWARDRVPILVGGTGLYIRAVLEGWTIPEVPPDETMRRRLQGEAERFGHQALHARLAVVDPAAAERIDGRNVRRVVRALEVFYHTGQPISELQQKHPPDYAVLKLGLTMPREALYARIDARVDRMIASGLVDEVRWLVEQGYDLELPSMSALGYGEIIQYLEGEISLQEAADLIKRHTRRFVRQQYNWFRLSDPSIHWIDATDPDYDAIRERVRTFMTES
jgi:tRNA dimethylallyltransferase